MTVTKDETLSRYYRYNFTIDGKRYSRSTKKTTERAALIVEEQARQAVLRRRDGTLSAAAGDTPTFSEWAEVTLTWQTDEKQIKRPDVAENTLRMVLAFFGDRPETSTPVEGGEYRGLRLGDPIEDPDLLVDFDEWMKGRGLSGARMNHYRSACSMLYRVAMLPKYRKLTGVRMNPFRDIGRAPTKRRVATVSIEQLRTLMQTAPEPVAIGVALNTLAPSLRLENIVELWRAEHLSKDRAFLTVPHKADRETGLPLVIAVPKSVRTMLAAIFKKYPDDPFVVPIRVGPARKRKRPAARPRNARYWAFVKMVKAAFIAAGLPYGRNRPDGVTFHSLRHTTNTQLARWGVPREVRRATAGHTTMAMTDWYTHVSGAETVQAVPILDRRLGALPAIVSKRLGKKPGNRKRRAS